MTAYSESLDVKKEIETLSVMIGDLAAVELTLHNELNQLSTRAVHVRESIRQMHGISEKCGSLVIALEERLKAIAVLASKRGPDDQPKDLQK